MLGEASAYFHTSAFETIATPDGVRWRVSVRPLNGDHTDHIAIIFTPLDMVNTIPAGFRLMLLALGAAGALMTPLAAMLLAGRALRPIATLTATARSIARSQKFDQRAPVNLTHRLDQDTI